MLLLNSTTSVLRVVTANGATIKPVWSAMDVSGTTFTPAGAINADITTATTTTVVAAPGSSTSRNVKDVSLANADASLSALLIVQQYDGTLTSERWRGTLAPGQKVAFDETGAWTIYGADGLPYSGSNKLSQLLTVVSDITNATTTFADATGLTCPLLAGRKYVFEAVLYHQTNATTTGAQYGVNIGATPTLLIASGQGQITSSVTAATFGASAAITALDTPVVVETTGPGLVTMAHWIAGTIIPSADGTFAIRQRSEVAVAGGLVTKAGSWLRIREADA